MGWENSDRREHLPSDWKQIRLKRFRMDGYRCTYVSDHLERCTQPAEECDHIGDRDDHRLEQLRSLCKYHHGKKSAGQGNAAMRAKRKQSDSRFRREEAHPGLL